MTNLRMKIAVGAMVLGLGGLAGYALGSNSAPPATITPAPAAAQLKPKVRKQVVHHTIHVRRKPKGTEVSDAATPASADQTASAAPPSPAPATTASAPAPAPTPAPAAVPVSNPSPAPVSTGTSGSAGGSSASYGDDEGSDDGGESEGGSDD